MLLNLDADQVGGVASKMQRIFQVVKVTGSLMRAGSIVAGGLAMLFKNEHLLAMDGEGREVCIFERKGGGLYTAKLRLTRLTFQVKPDQPFGGQE